MTCRDLLADARALLAAASSVESPDLRVLYTAKARTMFVPLQSEASMFGAELAAVEIEIGREKGGSREAVDLHDA